MRKHTQYNIHKHHFYFPPIAPHYTLSACSRAHHHKRARHNIYTHKLTPHSDEANIHDLYIYLYHVWRVVDVVDERNLHERGGWEKGASIFAKHGTRSFSRPFSMTLI